MSSRWLIFGGRHDEFVDVEAGVVGGEVTGKEFCDIGDLLLREEVGVEGGVAARVDEGSDVFEVTLGVFHGVLSEGGLRGQRKEKVWGSKSTWSS